jgi:deoxyribodipyrimidine photo-lyase
LNAPVPSTRIRPQNDAASNPSGRYVLYWMTSARRARSNFGLQRAAELAASSERPLVVLEALRCDHPYACDRFHRFVLQGMAANQRSFHDRPVLYYPYVEPEKGAGRGLLAALASQASDVVTDWYPAFFIPAMNRAAARHVPVRFEAVDSNGLIPVASHGRAFPTARGYRAFMQRVLREHLPHVPTDDPSAAVEAALTLEDLSRHVRVRWPPAGADLLVADTAALARLPIDHSVGPAPAAGGSDAAHAALRGFVRRKLASYAEDRNHPDLDATSRLSPYLHFGHIAAHEIFSAVMTSERWTSRRLGHGAAGAREGWWGVSPAAEAFLDQLVVWRELAFNGCAWTERFEAYDTLPAWARETLEAHQRDPRPHVYSRDTLERAATADPVWNAAQRQLVAEGWFHGYMRMLWGKKILEWTRKPAAALGVMEHLMNRYSLDGRDPVSHAGYGWVLGRYDRPWPERPVFGTVRCMTSQSARRKLEMARFLDRYGEPRSRDLFDD